MFAGGEPVESERNTLTRRLGMISALKPMKPRDPPRRRLRALLGFIVAFAKRRTHSSALSSVCSVSLTNCSNLTDTSVPDLRLCNEMDNLLSDTGLSEERACMAKSALDRAVRSCRISRRFEHGSKIGHGELSYRRRTRRRLEDGDGAPCKKADSDAGAMAGTVGTLQAVR